MISILLFILLIIALYVFLGIGTLKQRFQNPEPAKFQYVGCYNEKSNDMALPLYQGEVETPEQCALKAIENNSTYFGLQNVTKIQNNQLSNNPMCFISESGQASVPYDKHGESDTCLTLNKNIYGKKDTNAVYKILTSQEIETQENLKKKLATDAAIIASGGTPVEGCAFNPKAIQGGFETKLACKDYCRNADNNTLFGGALCSEIACENICNKCDDNIFCRWLTEPILTENEKIPKPIELEYKINDSEVLLLWEKPESIDAISHYSVVITDPNNPDKFEVEIQPNVKDDFIEHNILNLSPMNIYHVEVYSRNKFGYSMASNKVEVQTKYVSGDGYQAPVPYNTYEQNYEEIQKFIAELKEIIKKKKYEKDLSEGKVDISEPLDILIQDAQRDEKLKQNYNLEVFFNEK